MKRKLIALATVTTLGLSALAAPAVFAHGPGQGPGAGNAWGPGMMGGGMMGSGMMGNMMGSGMGPAMMGANGAPCPGLTAANASGAPLTIEDARKTVEQRLEWMGNGRLKVGTVEAKDDATISAEIVTLDGSLVEKFDIDRKTGFMRPIR